MKDSLVTYVVCPRDRTSLTPSADGASLECEFGHSFPVVDSLPSLLPETPEAIVQAGTADSFGAKWALLSEDDHVRLARVQHRWYDERYGWGDEVSLGRFLAGLERILDAGCGRGRDVARYARLSNAQVIGFDLSDAVALANRDFGELENVHFLKGDILTPPFMPESFDFVVADQVIHHTPDAQKAFHTLAGLVRPGGQIAVYVYRKKSLLREAADDQLRSLTTRMSIEDCMEFSEQLTELARELSRTGATITLERGVPLLGIPAGEHDVQRLIYWHLMKCFWSEEYGETLSTLTNFDWYHPPFASRHTPDEVRGWCADAELEILNFSVVDSGISVRAAKPASS